MKTPAILRAVDVLREVSRHDGDGVSLGHLSRALEIPKSSTANICEALESANCLKRTPRGFVLSWGVAEIGMNYLQSVDPLTRFYEYWSKHAGTPPHTLQLGMLVGANEMMFVTRQQGSSAIQLVGTVGKRMPAHCTAAGKALLAAQTSEELSLYFKGTSGQLATMTERSIRTERDLRAELQRIRDSGVAINDEETMPGVWCIGAVLKSDGPSQRRDAVGRDEKLALSMTVVKGNGAGASDDGALCHTFVAILNDISDFLYSPHV